jgi:hypothetical protein
MKIKISKAQWQKIGKTAGWIKKAEDDENPVEVVEWGDQKVKLEYYGPEGTFYGILPITILKDEIKWYLDLMAIYPAKYDGIVYDGIFQRPVDYSFQANKYEVPQNVITKLWQYVQRDEDQFRSDLEYHLT